jgi:hypothetical protein
MMVLINIVCFLAVRFLADLCHADRSTAFLLGWIAAVLAQGLLNKWRPESEDER